MSDAVIGFLGVIVGAGVAGAVSLLGERLTTKREREARALEREQKRKDIHDAFQRESILALQDAVDDLVGAVAQEREKRLAEEATTGSWPVEWRVAQASSEFHKARWKVSTLQSRIFDPELRDLARRIHGRTIRVLGAEDAEAMWQLMEEGNEILRQLDDRVTALLPNLF